MKNRFDICFDRLIGHEGGYVDDPDDPGGETNFGISKRSYPSVVIRNLTRSQAKNIYRSDYWGKPQCENLPLGVDYLVFDRAVNSGVSASVKALQRSVGASPDGMIGRRSLAAIAALSAAKIIDRLAIERAIHYTNLVIKRSKSRKYLRGWMKRLIETHRLALLDMV